MIEQPNIAVAALILLDSKAVFPFSLKLSLNAFSENYFLGDVYK